MAAALSHRARKSVVLALKVDAETASLLSFLPNKSEFIRAAIRGRLDRACVLCGGTGVRPARVERTTGRHVHVAPRLRCSDCGRDSPVVVDLDPAKADRNFLWREALRAHAFLAWGDAFCPACFARAVPCERCGHRLPASGPARAAHACDVAAPDAR